MITNIKPVPMILRAALVACLLPLATPARSQTPDSTISQIEKRGTLLVGIATFPPWAMRDSQGQLIGFEIDVAKKLAADLSVKLEFVPTAWDGIIPALLANKFDVIMGGLTITTPRNLTVNFSAPYDMGGTSIAVVKSMEKDFKLTSLDSPNITMSCRRASTACSNLKEFFPKATLRQFDDDTAVTQEVLNGNAQAFGATEPHPSQAVAANGDKVFLALDQDHELNPRGEAFGLRKGDVDTLNVLDNWVLINQKFFHERHHYWFETQEWAPLVGKTN